MHHHEREYLAAKSLSVAVIGLGRQSLEDHLPGLMASKYAFLDSVCDADESLARNIGTENGVPSYSDVAELLRTRRPAFAIVAVPHSDHLSIVRQCFENGVDVLKEKPFAMNWGDAVSLGSLATDFKRKLLINTQRRYNPIYLAFPQLLDRIGPPFLVDARYTICIDDPHTGWRGRRIDAGGGCIIDMGYHMIDLIMWFFGLPEVVFATSSCLAVPGSSYDAEDTACVMFSYKSGLNGVMRLSRSYHPKTEVLRAVGPGGIVEARRGNIFRLDCKGNQIERLTREPAWPSASADQIDVFSRIILGLSSGEEPFEPHFQHMAFIAACYESIKTKQAVSPSKFTRQDNDMIPWGMKEVSEAV